MVSIEQAAIDLSTGQITGEKLVRQCLEATAERNGQGSTVFTELYAQEAIEQARGIDIIRASGVQVPFTAGIPITIKDLFDVSGRVTMAGSVVLKNNKPASQDAVVVQRLRQAGFIIIGKSNMTEFAYSGLGVNPHYGTPLNPYDRQTGRIPGGSSSGATVAISDGFALGGVGTDTGGSCRIPAALCGIVGFKPTARRIPMDGVLPLSPSLDSVGPLASSVEGCAILDSVLSGTSIEKHKASSLQGLRFAVPQHYVLDSLDKSVATDFERSLTRLSQAGVSIVELNIPELEQISHINRMGGFTAAEAYAWHRDLLELSEDGYDPRVSVRIRKGAAQSAADYLDLLNARETLKLSVNEKTCHFDALVCPTVPTIAPTIESMNDEDTYHTNNLLMLRNPSVANILDCCSISVPCHETGKAPTGFMLIAANNHDENLLSIARGVEKLFLSH